MNDTEKELFADYPDVVTFEDMRVILGGKNKKLGRTTAYKLLKEKKIDSRKIGREYRIKKVDIIKLLLEK